MTSAGGRAGYPAGASVTRAELDTDPHPVLARLREREPVSWVPVYGGWLVTRRDLALRVLRDAGTFTVDDPRFTTARVVGPSMLSLDGAEHRRHRDPFVAALRRAEEQGQLDELIQAQAGRLVAALAPAGQAELRRGLAGPLAVAVVAEVLGLGGTEPAVILSWYDAIVGAVSDLAGQGQERAAHPAGHGSPDAGPHPGAGEPGAGGAGERGAAAFGELRDRLLSVMASQASGSPLAEVAASGGLSAAEVVSNAAVLMFGGIETTEGMISNAVLHLLSHPGQARLAGADPALAAAAVDESLRLEPAAALVDRYATADVRLGAAEVGAGELVSVSLAGANRDPAFFADPDRFDLRRPNARQQLAFARGPHFCIGAQLAAAQARAAITALLSQLPGLRLADPRPARPRGLVFRKPPELRVTWDPVRPVP
ncbi:MAG TPA: cytochrome P450 [Streptosporangiaceae bacterium]|jgi:cytochrome P450